MNECCLEVCDHLIFLCSMCPPYNPGMREPSPEVVFWRVSLGIIGFLVGMLTPAFAPHFPWEFLCIILPGVAFVAGGMFGRFRDRLTHGADGERR